MFWRKKIRPGPVPSSSAPSPRHWATKTPALLRTVWPAGLQTENVFLYQPVPTPGLKEWLPTKNQLLEQQTHLVIRFLKWLIPSYIYIITYTYVYIMVAPPISQKKTTGKKRKKTSSLSLPFIHQALSGAEDQRCVGFQLSLKGLRLWRSTTQKGRVQYHALMFCVTVKWSQEH